MKTTYYVIKILYVVEIIGVILVPWMIICDLFSIVFRYGFLFHRL